MIGNDSEIGPELRASQLKTATVYVLSKDQKTFVTMWCKVPPSEAGLAIFYAGDINFHLILIANPDDKLQDDADRVIHVFEYLGEV